MTCAYSLSAFLNTSQCNTLHVLVYATFTAVQCESLPKTTVVFLFYVLCVLSNSLCFIHLLCIFNVVFVFYSISVVYWCFLCV